MSDNKKWFKAWATILTDPTHSNLTLQQVGRWTRLMAYVVSGGERGKLKVIGPAKGFLLALDFESMAEARTVLKVLPNVQIQYPLNDTLDDYGSFIVIIKNWFKYQVDTTAYERVKRSRYKKRGEEKRSITSPSTPSASRLSADAAPLAENGGMDVEELEQREANRVWKPSTNESSEKSKAATPEEVKEIMEKWRQANPRGGTR